MITMKDSGIEWVGQIPSDWSLNRLQYCLSEIKVQNNPVQSEQVLSLVKDVGVMLYEDKGDVGNKAKADVSEYKLAFPNTLIVNSMNILIGSVGISKYFGCVSPVYYVFKETDSSDLRFINYIFNTREFQKELRKYANGILEIRLRVSANDIFKRFVPMPTKTEQTRIANFLDSKCAEIDALSDDIQSEIDTLEAYKRSIITEAVTKGLDKNVPMKDSNVEWIGKVPVEWGVSKLGNVLKLRNERNYKPLEEVNLISLYTDKGVVQHSDLEKTSGNIAQNADGYKVVHKNDIVVNIILAWMGAMGISKYEGVTSPAYDVYEIDEKRIVPHYCHYILRTPAMAGECYKYGRGIMMMRWRTYSSEFKKIKMPLPSLREQAKIADYLDDKCAEIESIIVQKQEQLTILAEYKKSIIYEYVTGKKEVPMT